MKEETFLNLILPFKDKMFRLAKRYLISQEVAEDATQDVLLKLWSNRHKIESYHNIEAFAMTMTKNCCLDKLKSKHAQNLKIVHTNYKDEHIQVEKEIEVKDSITIVEKLMNDLPQKQRVIMQLRDIEQYSFEEIGKILELKPVTIRVALSRARKSIRQKLIKYHNYGIQ
ncbi:MAG TPA: RNA polymerase sigma factor [Flavobacteriia bacterium]|nr:RNA polymerase sigma factor [Flavobacteriia bacterium]